MQIGLQQPDNAIAKVSDELRILNRAKIAGPNDSRTVDVGVVVYPLLKFVSGHIVDENQMLV